MNSRGEQVWVGLFVLIAAALLVAAVLSMAGVFRRGNIPHRAYFKFGGGLEPGAVARFGGIKAGSVQRVRVDPQDSTRIEIDFSVARNIPLKTDSVATITSLGVLGDNFLELTTGSRQAPLAPPGSVVKSQEAVSFTDLGDMAGELQPMVQQVLHKLSQRLDELQVTVARTNDLLNDRNRAHISASLSNLSSMLAEDRPKLSATSIIELRKTLASASSVMDQLDRTLNYNTGNIDQALENVRVTTQQLRELTEKVERRPYTLIRAANPPERKPGQN
jgi:phospholipid/cholesterol/gamma-HCH transport system substrate-binding protein